MLQLIGVIYLFGIRGCREALKVKCHSGYMAAIVVKGFGLAAQDADVASETLQQFTKSCNLPARTV